MNMVFSRQLPKPHEIKEQYPMTAEMQKIHNIRDQQIKDIFSGKDNRLILIIGPCSADNEVSVLDYLNRLRDLQEKVKDKLFFIPRVYTNKPRTTGLGYKGMLHQPDPNEDPDLLKGIIAIRELHTKVVKETGFTCADEILYPENHKYYDDILGYVAVGARSVEDQQHRMIASGLDMPVGMKNPTSGDLSVMMNGIIAAQSSHNFIYRGWDATSQGNLYAHAILRGFRNRHNNDVSNYHYETVSQVIRLYKEHSSLKNPAIIIDANHSNSGKDPFQQPRIIQEVLDNRRYNSEVKNIIKGFMVESYIEDGSQPIDGGVYGKSITDACLGWQNTEKMIWHIASQL